MSEETAAVAVKREPTFVIQNAEYKVVRVYKVETARGSSLAQTIRLASRPDDKHRPLFATVFLPKGVTAEEANATLYEVYKVPTLTIMQSVSNPFHIDTATGVPVTDVVQAYDKDDKPIAGKTVSHDRENFSAYHDSDVEPEFVRFEPNHQRLQAQKALARKLAREGKLQAVAEIEIGV